MSDNDEKILSAELNDDELKLANGGKCLIAPSDGKGNCNGAFYKEKCRATVESRSWCKSQDYCVAFSNNYTSNDIDDSCIAKDEGN